MKGSAKKGTGLRAPLESQTCAARGVGGGGVGWGGAQAKPINAIKPPTNINRMVFATALSLGIQLRPSNPGKRDAIVVDVKPPIVYQRLLSASTVFLVRRESCSACEQADRRSTVECGERRLDPGGFIERAQFSEHRVGLFEQLPPLRQVPGGLA